MINILSEFLEKPYDEIETMCDEIYRANSDFALTKKLPRDIIVKVTTHKGRGLIFTKHYQEPMEVLGKRIKIWKNCRKRLYNKEKALSNW